MGRDRRTIWMPWAAWGNPRVASTVTAFTVRFSIRSWSRPDREADREGRHRGSHPRVPPRSPRHPDRAPVTAHHTGDRQAREVAHRDRLRHLHLEPRPG